MKINKDGWKWVKLTDVCDFQGGSQPPKKEWIEEQKTGYVRMLQIRDFTQKREGKEEYVKETKILKMCNETDILIARYGASVGKILTGLAGAYNVAIMRTLPNETKLSKLYLKNYLLSSYFQNYILNVGSRAAQAGFNKDDLRKLNISLPSLEKQKKITVILDKASELIELRKQQLAKMDLLIKSKFIAMFGDPVTNPMGWDGIQLTTVANIVSGITKGRKTREQEMIEVPYMRVANVKDGHIDLSEIKMISATISEIEQYALAVDDVLMTEGGDPDKLGRGAIWRYELKDCIHQNHVFRVRLNKAKVHPQYFSEYLKQPKAKQYFLRCAKQTTGIASINMKQLKALPILEAPIDLQNEFAAFVDKVEAQKAVMQVSLAKLEINYKALMQQYFG